MGTNGSSDPVKQAAQKAAADLADLAKDIAGKLERDAPPGDVARLLLEATSMKRKLGKLAAGLKKPG
jgi:hypothetical protein